MADAGASAAVGDVSELYAEGKAGKLWNVSTQTRSETFRDWLLGILRDNNCRTVLDAACGTGVDSVLLVEEGFDVVSSDFSDQMLKYALQERWKRRKDARFDRWVIEEADWLTLSEDLEDIPGIPADGFDCVLCIGNSISHLPVPEGDLSNVRLALTNLMKFVKPGGILVIDHRNYDEIVATGGQMPGSVYYKYKYAVDLKSNVVYYADGQPNMIVVGYFLDLNKLSPEERKELKVKSSESNFRFQVTCTTHSLDKFTRLLDEVFVSSAIDHKVFGDFKPLGEIPTPAYYMHVVRKSGPASS